MESISHQTGLVQEAPESLDPESEEIWRELTAADEDIELLQRLAELSEPKIRWPDHDEWNGHAKDYIRSCYQLVRSRARDVAGGAGSAVEWFHLHCGSVWCRQYCGEKRVAAALEYLVHRFQDYPAIYHAVVSDYGGAPEEARKRLKKNGISDVARYRGYANYFTVERTDGELHVFASADLTTRGKRYPLTFRALDPLRAAGLLRERVLVVGEVLKWTTSRRTENRSDAWDVPDPFRADAGEATSDSQDLGIFTNQTYGDDLVRAAAAPHDPHDLPAEELKRRVARERERRKALSEAVGWSTDTEPDAQAA